MSEGAAINASPLIYLARVGRLDLLRILPAPITVPALVAQEVAAGVPREPAVEAIAEAAWLEVVHVVPPVPEEIGTWDLGPGESAVLSWARSRPGALAVMDDLQGRRCANSLGVPVMGTLAVLLAAKRTGRIDAIRHVVQELLANRMYLSERIVREVLAAAGE